MKLVLAFSLLVLFVQLCWSQQPETRRPVTEDQECYTGREYRANESPTSRNYDNRQYYPKASDYRNTIKYFSTCKEILQRYPDTKSDYYWVSAGTDKIRRVYCDMETYRCGEKGWEKFYYMDLKNNLTTECPGHFKKYCEVKKGSMEKVCYCEGYDRTCTRASFDLEDTKYFEICAKIGAYQVGMPSAFKPFLKETDRDDKKFLDGITFSYGKDMRHLWGYVVGAQRTYNKQTTDKEVLKTLCPGATPDYKFNTPHFMGDHYYCDSGLYEMPTKEDETKFHREHRLFEGKQCELPNYSCRKSGQPWFYKHSASFFEEYIELRSCFDEESADIRLDNIEIYLR